MKTKLLLLAVSLLLVGCSNANRTESISKDESQTSSQESPSEDNTSSESSIDDQSSEPAEEATFKAQFYSVNDSGVITGDSTSTSFTENVQSYFMVGNTSLIKNASAPSGYAQLNYIGNKGDEGRFSTMILGSKNQDGNLKLDFNCNIMKVKVEAQGYCKHIAYNDTWSVDTDCSLSLEGQSTILELQTATDAAAEIKTQEYIFDDFVNSLNFTTGDGRVFLHSIEITYMIL